MRARKEPIGDNLPGKHAETVKILAFGAHPDDIILWCGGTLAKYAAAGHDIFMAVFCRGDAAASGLPPDEFARLREEELHRSAAIVNATVFPLRFPDFQVPTDHATKLRIAEIMRSVAPDVMFTHDDKDFSLDHRTVSELVDESFIMAGASGINTGSPASCRHSMIYHMDSVGGLGFVPDAYVDITDFFEVKRRMIECHHSVVDPYKGHPFTDTLEWIEVHARFRGIQSAVRYAEAFCWPRRWSRVETKRLLP